MKRTQVGIALLAAALAVQPLTAAAQATTDRPAQQQMTDHMKEMQSQMEKIRRTTDPDERHKLMAEHMKSMHEGMQMMRGMGGGMMGMMHGGAGAGMSGGRGGAQGPQMMERRMDMMQMMMEQMMQHQQMMQPAPPK